MLNRPSWGVTLFKKISCVVLLAVFMVYTSPQAWAKDTSADSSDTSDTATADTSSNSVKENKNDKKTSSTVTLEDLTAADMLSETSDDDSTDITVRTLSSLSGDDGYGPQNMANNFNFDLSTGTGYFSLPLFTPSGRKGVQPSLSLVYSPRGGNGLMGVGWQIGLGQIERSTKVGVPSFDVNDTLVCSLGGGSFELVDLGSGEFQARNEGAFTRFTYDGSRWEARDKQGNTYYFGKDNVFNDDSRVMDASGHVFRWYLSEVKDIYGNYYAIQNYSDGSFKIYYTGEPGTDNVAPDASGGQNFLYQIDTELDTVTRQDPVNSYRSTFGIEIEDRITAVNVKADGDLMRRYEFTYQYSSATGRSLLTEINEIGADGLTQTPAVTITYTDGTDLVYDVQTVNEPLEPDKLFNVRGNVGDYFHENVYTLYPHWNGNADIGIFNNESNTLVPWGTTYTQNSHPWDGYRQWTIGSLGNFNYLGSNDTAFYAWTYLFSNVQKSISISASADLAFFYMNGDYSNPQQQGGTFTLKEGYNILEVTGYNQNDANPAVISTYVANLADKMSSTQVLLPHLSGDFNGDGLADVATFKPTLGQVSVALSNGSNFQEREVWISGFGVNQQILLGDFNRDKKTDIMRFVSAEGEWYVAFSDGTQFVDAGRWKRQFGNNNQPGTGDFDGDGLTDIYYTYEESGETHAVFARNHDDLFWNWEPVVTPVVGVAGEQTFTADFNGDGMTDFGSYDKDSGECRVYLNTGGFPNDFQFAGTFTSNYAGNNIVVSDFNSDGLTDIGYYDYTNGILAYRASIDGFTFSTNAVQVPLTFDMVEEDVQVQSADFNGDGVIDYMAYNSNSIRRFDP